MSSKNLRLVIPLAAALFVVVGVYGVATANFAPASPAAPAEVQQDGLPTGAVMFFDLDECPTDWSPLTDAEGRYLVGLPDGGNLRGLVGTELTNEENRPAGLHDHPIDDQGHGHAVIDPGHGHEIEVGKTEAIVRIEDLGHSHRTQASEDTGEGSYIDSTDLDDNYGDVPIETTVEEANIDWQEGPDDDGHVHDAWVFTTRTDVEVESNTTGITVLDGGLKEDTNAPYIQFLVCRKD